MPFEFADKKLKNQFEARYVQSNSRVEGIASSLATYYMLKGGADKINKELDIYKSITREDIKRVANTYLNPNQRLELDYFAGEAPDAPEVGEGEGDIKVVENKLQVNKIYFESDSSKLTKSATTELDKIIDMMFKYPKLEILAETYTDSKGGDDYNQELSQKRAEAVKSYLVIKGIAENRIKAVGKGESNPVVDCFSQNCTEEQHEQNRRTEFTIIKK